MILIIEDDVPVIFVIEIGNRSSVYRKGHPVASRRTIETKTQKSRS